MCVRELNFRLLLRGLRADSLFAYPHGALRFDWVYANCIAGFRDKMFVMASTPKRFNSEGTSRCAKRSMSSFRSVFADIPPEKVASFT